MKKILLFCAVVMGLAACSENIEDRAAREAREYTAKFCPTPVQHDEYTDSLVFDKATRTYTFYRTLCGVADNAQVIQEHRAELDKALKEGILNNTAFKAYKEAGFNFRFVYRSETTRQTLYEYRMTHKDYR